MEPKTPYFLIDEAALEKNLQILKSVSDASGAKILLAQKAYSCFATYPLIAEYLDGTAASGLYEARLGKEHFGKQTHVFSPAFREEETEELAKYCDHVIFNSPAQAKNSRPFSGRGISVAGCASIPNVPRSKDTRSTTRARPVQGWARRF